MVIESKKDYKNKCYRVIVHTNFFYKITHFINSKTMAHEYAERILVHGDFFKDDRGVKTFIPIQNIMKIKIVPPGIELEMTETEVG